MEIFYYSAYRIQANTNTYRFNLLTTISYPPHSSKLESADNDDDYYDPFEHRDVTKPLRLV